MSGITYLTVPDRTPRRSDARLFRAYWRRQFYSHRPLRKFMRQLAHDYWIARTQGS